MSQDSADEAPGETEVHADWIGRVIEDRYRIEELLAEGGMGAVFEATHLRMDRRVALKIVHPDHMVPTARTFRLSRINSRIEELPLCLDSSRGPRRRRDPGLVALRAKYPSPARRGSSRS